MRKHDKRTRRYFSTTVPFGYFRTVENDIKHQRKILASVFRGRGEMAPSTSFWLRFCNHQVDHRYAWYDQLHHKRNESATTLDDNVQLWFGCTKSLLSCLCSIARVAGYVSGTIGNVWSFSPFNETLSCHLKNPRWKTLPYDIVSKRIMTLASWVTWTYFIPDELNCCCVLTVLVQIKFNQRKQFSETNVTSHVLPKISDYKIFI